jgi:hypothetical protein
MKPCTLSLIGAIGLCVAVATLLSCSVITLPSLEKPQSTMKKVTVHTTIDDRVIDAGEAYAVIDPVWWTANNYSATYR